MRNTTKLLKIKSARAFLKDATTDELHTIQKNIDQLISEKKEQELMAEKERLEKEKALDEVLAKAQEMGLSRSEIMNRIGGQRTKSAATKRHYNVDGEMIEWGGRGRLPERLKALKDSGQDIENYRVTQE